MMVSHPFLLLAICTIMVTGQAAPVKVRPTWSNGVESINMANPTLANMANLAQDPDSYIRPAMYFTADKSNPNLWRIRLDSLSGPSSWWIEPALMFAPGTLPPFISLDVVKDTIVGAALPSAVNNAGAYDTALNVVHFDQQFNQTGTDPINFAGYSFYSVTVSRLPNANKKFFAYVVGWADDVQETYNNTGFFVARFEISSLGTPNPIFTFRPDLDVLDQVTTDGCYDLYTTLKKPSLWVDEGKGNLYVAIPGRCSEILRVALPAADQPFSTATYTSFLLPDQNTYISSATRNAKTNILFMAVSSYDRMKLTQVWSLSLDSMERTTAPVVILNFNGQANPVLVSAVDYQEELLFALAADTNQIFKFSVDPATFALTQTGIASLPPSFQEIGSVAYYGIYLYFTTYGPDAVIARIHKNASFCPEWCGPLAFCLNKFCACQAPWRRVQYDNGSFTCENPIQYDYVNKEIANEKAAIVFGVFFGIALVAALVGWYRWWKGSQINYQQL